MKLAISRQFLLCASLMLPSLVQAQQNDSGLRLVGSGFVTLVAGKVYGGDPVQDSNGYKAPLYVADYAQAGVYEANSFSMQPDSRVGLQGSVQFNANTSITGQVVSRGAHGGNVNLEWLYASHNLSDKLTLQIGRKRLPLFYYSETQDIGFTYPWVHLPPQPYGWEIVNYNGINAMIRDQWGDWAGSMNIFSGQETREDNPFWKLYNGRSTRTDSKWSQILGADLTLNRDWLELRGAYIQSNFQNRFEDPTVPEPYTYSPLAGQKIYTLSLAIDYKNWMLRNEYMYINRDAIGETDFAQLVSVGYRFGKLMPILTWANYKMALSPDSADPAVIDPSNIDPESFEAHSTLVFTLRYDLSAKSAIKVQLERWQDRGGPNYNGGVPYGNPRLLTLSYDRVF